ncbi:uncharacterized protein LOC142465158 isoform X2 [Ascaphus truei]|uniref:uncharacterized protein LOC142465158 isoform X2 n=1 Tax=Ascaphus truei TaxID=8439 RepID=UPI003F5A9918
MWVILSEAANRAATFLFFEHLMWTLPFWIGPPMESTVCIRDQLMHHRNGLSCPSVMMYLELELIDDGVFASRNPDRLTALPNLPPLTFPLLWQGLSSFLTCLVHRGGVLALPHSPHSRDRPAMADRVMDMYDNSNLFGLDSLAGYSYDRDGPDTMDDALGCILEQLVADNGGEPNTETDIGEIEEQAELLIKQEIPEVKIKQEIPEAKIKQEIPEAKIKQEIPEAKIKQEIPDAKVQPMLPTQPVANQEPLNQGNDFMGTSNSGPRAPKIMKAPAVMTLGGCTVIQTQSLIPGQKQTFSANGSEVTFTKLLSGTPLQPGMTIVSGNTVQAKTPGPGAGGQLGGIRSLRKLLLKPPCSQPTPGISEGNMGIKPEVTLTSAPVQGDSKQIALALQQPHQANTTMGQPVKMVTIQLQVQQVADGQKFQIVHQTPGSVTLTAGGQQTYVVQTLSAPPKVVQQPQARSSQSSTAGQFPWRVGGQRESDSRKIDPQKQQEKANRIVAEAIAKARARGEQNIPRVLNEDELPIIKAYDGTKWKRKKKRVEAGAKPSTIRPIVRRKRKRDLSSDSSDSEEIPDQTSPAENRDGVQSSTSPATKQLTEEDSSDATETKKICPINTDMIKKEKDDEEPDSCDEIWWKGLSLYHEEINQTSNQYNDAIISLNTASAKEFNSSPEFKDPVGGTVFDVESPFQPSAENVSLQCFGNRTLKFQSSWYSDFPWLHYSPQLQAVLCFTCGKAESMGLLDTSRTRDSAFTVVGFSDWKNAWEKFESHQKSKNHEFAIWKLIHVLQNQKREAALQQQRKVRQAIPSACLNKLIHAMRFLIQRGHTFQGHKSIEEGLFELLKLLGQDNEMFRHWLMTNQNFTSAEIQYEIIGLMSHEIINLITKDVNQGSMYYSVIIDSIQNSDTQQLSLCLRYLDADMQSQEDFIGFIKPMEETGTSAANLILDLLARHSLPIDLLRGIAFEGTAGSSLCYMESCALLKQKQPLAMFVHCGAPSGSFLTRDSSHASPILQQALYSVNDLCKLFSKTTKYKFLLSEMTPCFTSQTRYLCPSKWCVHLPVINTVIQNYRLIIEGLEEMDTDTNEVGVRAHFLLEKFVEGNTFVSLLLIRSIMEPLNILNINLEEQNRLMDSTLKKVRMVKEILVRVRQEATVVDFLRQAEEVVTKHNLVPIATPPPRRWRCPAFDSADQQVAETTEDFFKKEYFKMLDAIISQLENRFLQQGFIEYCHLEDVLLCAGKGGESDSVIEEKLSILSKYPEFNMRMLKVQLEMFAHKNTYSSLAEAVRLYKSVTPEVEEIFSELGKFLKFLLIIPVSSSENEQACSPFQRLRTMLKFTTTETRSSDVAVCYVDEIRLDNLCLETIAHNFVQGL